MGPDGTPVGSQRAENADWLVAWDDKGTRAMSKRAGTWSPTVGPKPIVSSSTTSQVIGDYFGADELWHLPDFRSVAKPSKTKSGDQRSVGGWAIAAGTAVALEGLDGSFGLTDWALEVWDLGGKGSSRLFPFQGPPGRAEFEIGRDGKQLLLRSGGLRLVDLGTGEMKQLRSVDEVVSLDHFGFSADASRVCLTSTFGRTVMRLDGTPAATSGDGVEVQAESETCEVVKIARLPEGRQLLQDEPSYRANSRFGAGVARTRDGAFTVALDRAAQETNGEREFHVRVFQRQSATPGADLAFPGDASASPQLRFQGQFLVVRSGETDGGIIDLMSLSWRVRFGRAETQVARAARERASVASLLEALGAPPNGHEWLGPICPSTADCSRVTGVRLGADDEPGTAVIEQRSAGIEGEAAATVVDLYDGWFKVTRISDGKLLATVIRTGAGAVALLSGGAVETFGMVPDGAQFCRFGAELHPWSRCRDRFTVRGGLFTALQGHENYLQ